MTTDIGAPAPEFSLRDSNLAEVRLTDFRDRRAVVLVFYPFAFTPTCTGELCAIRDDLASLENDRVQVLAVSCDPPATLRAFASSQSLSYPLLSDFWPHGAAARAYGVFNETIGAAVRGTFIIDREGLLRWQVVNAIPDPRDVAEYKTALAAL
ncbi:MAG TPA: peroxiredoxin [Mycobacteriales bacterium]|nr:peroxiredoxin [Mycobacteriales bacterium]